MSAPDTSAEAVERMAEGLMRDPSWWAEKAAALLRAGCCQ